MGEVLDFKFHLTQQVASTVDVQLKIYASYSNVVPTAQYNDFSFTVIAGVNNSIVMRPSSEFLDDVCPASDNGGHIVHFAVIAIIVTGKHHSLPSDYYMSKSDSSGNNAEIDVGKLTTPTTTATKPTTTTTTTIKPT